MSAMAAGAVACTAAVVVGYARWRRQRRQQHQRGHVLVVGSINVDLYQRTDAGAVRFGGEAVRCPESGHALPPGLTLLSLALRPVCCRPSLRLLPAAQVDVLPLKGMTLPASSFVAHPKMAAQQSVASRYAAGEEEAFLLTMDGPFEQKTGGKGANAAAAAAQTFACELYGNLGKATAAQK